MNLVLIGYRGTGKSVVSQAVAARLAMDRVSMDEEIVRRAGRPIPEIVAEHGWSTFRDLETQLAQDLAGADRLVVDCGGGVIERDANVRALRSNGAMIWLQASVPTIVARIEGGSDRPALVQGKTFTEEVTEVLERRTPLYAAAAHASVNTDDQTIEQVVDQVIACWNKERSCS